MRKGLKVGLLAGTALGLTGIAAADVSDIEDRVAALEALVAELKAELAAERADMDEAIVRLDKVESAAPTDRTFATNTGFMVGDTTFKLAGFIDVDAHATTRSDGGIASNSIARDFYIPSATPSGGEGNSFNDITEQAARYAITAQKEVGGHAVAG